MAASDSHTETSVEVRGGPTVAEVHAQAREKDDPYSADAGYPTWVLVLCGLVVLFALVHLVGVSSGASAEDYDKERLAFRKEMTPAELRLALAKKGEMLYVGNCANCHQKSGMGDGVNYPPLVDSEWVTGDVERLISLVHLGVKGPIEVAGKTYNAQAMAAYGGSAKPSDQDFALLLTYIRKAWGNGAGPVSAEQVAYARGKLDDAGKTDQWTQDALLALEPDPAFPKVEEEAPEEGEKEPEPATPEDKGA